MQKFGMVVDHKRALHILNEILVCMLTIANMETVRNFEVSDTFNIHEKIQGVPLRHAGAKGEDM
jgi:hypothetical protein